MNKQTLLYIILFFSPLALHAQSVSDIIADIYEQVAEYGGDLENLSQDMMEIYQNPININTATAEDLQRLRFLSDKQIDNILLYVDKHPMVDIAELQLVPGLRDYEVRDLRYFLVAGPTNQQPTLYAKEVFRFAKHELSLRTDARNLENYKSDPFYGNFRYRFNYKNRIKAGVTVQRGAGEEWKKIHYGGFVELNNISPHLKTLTLGNYQAQFGQGLVLGEEAHVGKSSYILSSTNGPEGLHKYSSVSDDYDYLHGIGATLQLGNVDVSALYSIKKEQKKQHEWWHHIVGTNVTYRQRYWQIGLTAKSDIHKADSTQTAFGANFRYKRGKWDVFGEAAASYDTIWGYGAIAGMRVYPADGAGLQVMYHYYSPTYHNDHAQSFAETSKVNDENGLYIGTEIKLIPKWRLSSYFDLFYFSGPKYGIPQASLGWDAMVQADWETTEQMNMYWKARAKRKGDTDTYSARYQLNWNQGGWHLRTQLDGTFVNKTGRGFSWGASVLQDVHYSFQKVPITLQLRLQAFDIRQWDNRIYIYENDVLYAFSIPASYGVGGRAYLNFRYQICKQVAMYLRVSETIYHPIWDKAAKPTRTDIHLLLRASL